MVAKPKKNIIFIIPAYNEAQNLPLLLNNLKSTMEEKGYPYTIIIIDDASTDRTNDIVKEFSISMPIKAIRHEKNSGVGEGFRRGFKEALSFANGDDILITKEADNTSDIKMLPEIIKRVEVGYDVVLASCYAPGGEIIGTSLFRRILSSGANAILKIFFPIQGINTYSSFYRGYRCGIIFKAASRYGDNLIVENGFACMVELLIKLNRLGARIAEVPHTLYFNARKGKSKMKILSTIMGYARVIRREWKVKK